MILNRNLALSREKLLELAWDYAYDGDSRTVDVHIQKLRKKLGLEGACGGMLEARGHEQTYDPHAV